MHSERTLVAEATSTKPRNNLVAEATSTLVAEAMSPRMNCLPVAEATSTQAHRPTIIVADLTAAGIRNGNLGRTSGKPGQPRSTDSQVKLTLIFVIGTGEEVEQNTVYGLSLLLVVVCWPRA